MHHFMLKNKMEEQVHEMDKKEAYEATEKYEELCAMEEVEIVLEQLRDAANRLKKKIEVANLVRAAGRDVRQQRTRYREELDYLDDAIYEVEVLAPTE